MNVAEFIAKWKNADLKERSAAQEHFIDLCRLVGHPTPVEADPSGATFCFEKGASKAGGGEGFADVWKKNFWGVEYKGKHKDLDGAYTQLLQYRESIDNPPLLVTCDMDRLLIHTNFTNTPTTVYEIPLQKVGEPRNLEILNAMFFDPEKLKPGKTSETITQDAARHFAGIAESMRKRGLDSGHVAHFLDRVVFCLFAEDIGLLPDMVFSRIVEKSAADPARFGKLIGQLFEAMAHGGDFGMETIRHFNGSLFDDRCVLDLTPEEVTRITEAAQLDWSAVDPSIFGTLFERGLDPAKRAQLGAHFTGRADIEEVAENVIMIPLRREWAEAKSTIENLLTTGTKKPDGTSRTVAVRRNTASAQKKAFGEASSMAHRFLTRLQTVKVLDPACGSGNFLYVTLLKLKDLEKEVILYAMERGLGGFLPMVGPWQLYGMEINPYAFDLAQMTVWIGWLQWIRFNGFGQPQEPILRPMTGNFRCMDAIIDLTDPANPKEPQWEKVDAIVGNPPFLGGKMLRRELGDTYMSGLFALWKGRVPHEADLCCYWFEKARAHISAGHCKRAGLLATQGIRGGANREVLQHIQESGEIFWAISDREWVLDGANVHVSMVAFGAKGVDGSRVLDGKAVNTINAHLSASSDLTVVAALPANLDLSFMGITPAGPFDVSFSQATQWLLAPNPHGRPNSDVLRPYFNGEDLNKRARGVWTVDFGVNAQERDAAFYESPFSYLKDTVLPVRATNARESYRTKWWLYAEARSGMRRAFVGHGRYLATCMVAKYRIFVWLDAVSLPANVVIAFARSDDYFYGVLHSRLHEVWSLKLGTRLETRPRYTPTTCFETFPLPTSTPAQETAIAAAARELNALRENWLNPPEWTREEILEFPGTVGGPWDRYIDPATVTERDTFKIGTVKYPRFIPRDAESAANLAKRTLTNLYNQRPTWLADAHRHLDEAVFLAYGWTPDVTEDELLAKLLELNVKRTSSQGNEQETTEQEEELK